MLLFTKPKQGLAKEIEDTLTLMASIKDKTCDEYEQLLSTLKQLYDLNQKGKDHISKDSMLIVAGNLTGILLILCYEQKDVITSKALGFVMKGRV